jgi:hypothetical protein
MASIFGRELAARFTGYKPSQAKQADPRGGVCVCGRPVRAHFTLDNRKLSCEQTAAADVYELPDGRLVLTDATATKGARWSTFTLKGGRSVDMFLVCAAKESR